MEFLHIKIVLMLGTNMEIFMNGDRELFLIILILNKYKISKFKISNSLVEERIFFVLEIKVIKLTFGVNFESKPQ